MPYREVNLSQLVARHVFLALLLFHKFSAFLANTSNIFYVSFIPPSDLFIAINNRTLTYIMKPVSKIVKNKQNTHAHTYTAQRLVLLQCVTVQFTSITLL